VAAPRAHRLKRGQRGLLHPLLLFLALVGGLVGFGAASLVLGPMALAITLALVDIWRTRTAHGQPAEAALKDSA
jgi:predicted PurR-regulated permease PerM